VGQWGERTGDLFINATVYFSNVPEGVMRYELGGYAVLKKWLGYRHRDRRDGKPLTLADAQHFGRSSRGLERFSPCSRTLMLLTKQPHRHEHARGAASVSRPGQDRGD